MVSPFFAAALVVRSDFGNGNPRRKGRIEDDRVCLASEKVS